MGAGLGDFLGGIADGASGEADVQKKSLAEKIAKMKADPTYNNVPTSTSAPSAPMVTPLRAALNSVLPKQKVDPPSVWPF